MRADRYILCVAAFLVGTLRGPVASAVPQRSAAEEMTTLIADLESGRIAEVWIYEMDPSALTRVSVTPEYLWRWASYRTHILSKDRRLSRIATAFRRARPADAEGTGDHRTGLVFFSAGGAQLDALYIDADRQSGSVNTRRAHFGPNLAVELRAELGLHY